MDVEEIKDIELRIKTALSPELQSDFDRFKLMLIASVEKDSMRLASEILDSKMRRIPGYNL